MINIIIEVHGGRYRDKPISSEILKKITAALKGADYEKEFRVKETFGRMKMMYGGSVTS